MIVYGDCDGLFSVLLAYHIFIELVLHYMGRGKVLQRKTFLLCSLLFLFLVILRLFGL